MGRGRRWIEIAISVALGAALVILLVTWDRAEPPPSSTKTPTEAQGSPTTSPSPEPVPTPNTRGNDFKRIWSEINRFRNWLAEHPDPALLDEIYHPECACYRDEIRALRRLVANGWRYDDAGVRTLALKLLDRPAPRVAVLRVVTGLDKQVVVDDVGRVVETGVGWRPTAHTFTLVREGDGRWRVRLIVKEGAVG